MAQVDTSIYRMAQPQQIDWAAPVRMIAAGQQIADARQRNRLMDAAEQSTQALNDAYAQSYDPATGQINQNRLFGMLAQSGQGSAIPQAQEAFSNAQSAAQKVRLGNLEEQQAQLGMVSQLLSGVNDPQSWAVARQQATRMGIPLDGVPEQYDPRYVQQLQNMTISAQQRMENYFKQQGLDLQRQKMGAPTGNPIEVTGPDGRPTLVQRYGDGSLRPVEGFTPKARNDGLSITTNPDGTVNVTQGAPNIKLTEGQSKDLTYLTRGEAAMGILDNMGPILADPGQRVAGAVPLAGNLLTSPEFQQAQQAGREFLSAVLRKDTGAAITQQEMDIYGQTYLPQPGDSPEVLQQKAESRRIALDAIRTGLGTASPLAPERGQRGTPGAAPQDRGAQLDSILGF